MIAEIILLSEADDVTDDLFSGVVTGVRFSGHDYLYWLVFVHEDLAKTINISHDQGAAFVAGESSC